MIDAIRRGLEDFFNYRYLHAICVMTIALSVFVISAFGLFLVNAGELMASWKEGIRIIAYLQPDTQEAERAAVIDEIREYFSSTQVGSSTMPQKRNPWNSEHVKSLWKAFAPRVMSFYMDQISEHQRDLTNSASGRFVADYLAGFAAAVSRMNKILKGLTVNREQLLHTLEQRAGSSVLAEAAYILLSQNGESDAHEIIRVLTLEAEQKNLSLKEVMESKPEVWQKVSQRLKAVAHKDAHEFFSSPAHYKGMATEKARALSAMWTHEMSGLAENLGLNK